MIEIDIPHIKKLNIENVIFDFNGTLACDGKIKDEVKIMIKKLAENCKIYIATADTNGTTAKECENLPVEIFIFNKNAALLEKANLAEKLNPHKTACFGNGYNDIEMFKKCDLSVCVIGEEGIYAGILPFSHIVVNSIEDAIMLLLKPNRLIADMRG